MYGAFRKTIFFFCYNCIPTFGHIFFLDRKVYYCYFFYIKFIIDSFFLSPSFSCNPVCLQLKKGWPFINNLVNNILLVSVFNRFFYCFILILINCSNQFHIKCDFNCEASTERFLFFFKTVSLKNNKTWPKNNQLKVFKKFLLNTSSNLPNRKKTP